MKKIFFALLLVAFGINAQAQKTAEPKLLVYYFHISERCRTCIQIEEETQKFLNTVYEEKIKTGEIVFKAINVDLDENKVLKTKYQMYGSGLLLVKPLEKGETNLELTNEAFQFVPGNIPKFRAVLRTEIEKLLKS